MLALVLALAATGQIRQCQTAATYQQSVQSYSYAAPAVASYAAPYVEKVAFVAVEDPYYANLVGSQVRAQFKAKENLEAGADLAAKVGALAEAVGRLESRIAGAASSPDPEPPAPPKPDAPTPPAPSPTTPAPVPPTSSAGQPNAAVLATLKTNCMKCHMAPAKAGGGFVMFKEDGSLAALSPLDKVLIDQAVYSGDMPKGGKPLEADAYSALRAWISEDGEAIAAAVKLCQKKGN